MKKLGLITIYHVPNFGSVLQTYATQIVVERMGLECHVIKYKYPNEWHYSQGQIKPSIKTVIGRLWGIKPTHRKANSLSRFTKHYFKFTKSYKNLDSLKSENWDEYDIFAVGSDQVWNSHFTFGDSVFLLSFLPNDKPRISIASSFAVKTIPDNIIEKYRTHLCKFDAISIREKNGINIINNQLGIKCDPMVLLDPTLLLSREDWMGLFPRSNFKKRKKYILLYMLTYAFNPRPQIYAIIKYLQQKYDYDILALEGFSECAKECDVDVIDRTDSSIPEFIDMFMNADIVVTSSFHGTAFAVNFGIPLISLVPDCDEDDRQSSFLKSVGLENCIVKSDSVLEDINFKYDTQLVMSKLNTLRAQSLSWLKDKLNP